MFHNFQTYDSHFIFQETGKYNFKINVVPETAEKYMSYTIQRLKKEAIKPWLPLVFVENVHFLNNLLENLVKCLPITTAITFKNAKKAYPAKVNLIYITNCAINDKNYEHVLNIWEAFNINNMKDYHDLYSKVHALLLAGEFKIFRKKSINSFDLDPAYYLLQVIVGMQQ